MMKVWVLGGFLAFQVPVHADSNFEQWLSEQSYLSRVRIMQNISPYDGRPGVVLASPSRHNPDYYYHWVRDAALTMMGLGLDRGVRDLQYAFRDFVEFTKINQQHDNLGEPKFMVDGSPFLGPWGRPQNDGPALRAGSFIYNIDLLTAAGLDANEIWSVVERDLDYVATEIYAPNFDLWEENFGQHFYTRMTHHWGLSLGSEFAAQMGYHDKAAWYASQAQIVASLIVAEHYRADVGQIVENIHNLDRKPSGLDMATVLALNHTKTFPLMAFGDPLVTKTVTRMVDAFHGLYPINQRYPDLGTAVGRYPEDVYDGGPNHYGNAWFLTTLGLAEYFYEFARELASAPYVWSTQDLAEFAMRHGGLAIEVDGYLSGEQVREFALRMIAVGDVYINRARFHMDHEGRMSEQMDRHSGYMRSAHDLTWSYVSFLTAVKARDMARWAIYGSN